MRDLEKFISTVYEKHLLEDAVHHYSSLERVTSFYPVSEFEALPVVRNKLYAMLEECKGSIYAMKQAMTPAELEEARKLYYKRYKLPF